MINVTMYRKQEAIHAFKIEGHANSGPYGYDLVCAAVSAVSFGAVNAVISLCHLDDVHVKQAGDEGGYLHIELPPNITEQNREKAQLILEAMLVSLQTIEREYNSFIKITDK